MRSAPFTRPTLVAAVELLEQHSQARFNQMVLRLGLEDEISSGTSLSVANKCVFLGRIVVQRAEAVLDTLEGSMTLGEAVMRCACCSSCWVRCTDCWSCWIEEYGRLARLRAWLMSIVASF